MLFRLVTDQGKRAGRFRLSIFDDLQRMWNFVTQFVNTSSIECVEYLSTIRTGIFFGTSEQIYRPIST